MNSLLTPVQVAELLGIRTKTVNSLCNRKKIRFIQVDAKHRRFTEEMVHEFIENQTVQQESKPPGIRTRNQQTSNRNGSRKQPAESLEEEVQELAAVKRYNKWYLRFQYQKVEFKLLTEANLKTEAQATEADVRRALRINDFSNLNAEARNICNRILERLGHPVPPSLLIQPETPRSHDTPSGLTLKMAAKMACDDPETQRKSEGYRQRFGSSIIHLLKNMGADTSVASIRVRDIRQYMLERERQGAAAATINRERGVLSKIFRILIENELADRNPVSLTKPADERAGQRKAYLSHGDFLRIVAALPDWYRPLVQMAYYTGMRQGEIRELKRSCLFLNDRVIRLNPHDTKEQKWKTVPIHKDLIPVLERALSGPVRSLEYVFLKDGNRIRRTHMRRVWETALKRVGVQDIHFHDLRHTWKTNARRSGIDEEIRSKIMGHATRSGSTHEGYGFEFDEELIEAIDKLTFHHGDTVVWAVKREKICRILGNKKAAKEAVNCTAKKSAVAGRITGRH